MIIPMLQILGLQKLTLLDFPGNMACTVFLGGCNFRCPFCHNSPLVVNPDFSGAMPQEEFFSFLEKRKGILDGVCITGGEPLLSNGIFDFVRAIKQMGYQVKLDTNGSFPARLEQLLSACDVDYVAMDIKNAPSLYRQTVGVESFEIAPVMESVRLLMSGNVPYEFRTTVVSELHNRQSFEEIGVWLAGAKQYYLQAFVDSGALIEDGLHACSKDEMEAFCDVLRPYIPSVALRGLE